MVLFHTVPQLVAGREPSLLSVQVSTLVVELSCNTFWIVEEKVQNTLELDTMDSTMSWQNVQLTSKWWQKNNTHPLCQSLFSIPCLPWYTLTAVLLSVYGSVRCWWPVLALTSWSRNTALTWCQPRLPPCDDCWPGKRPEYTRNSAQTLQIVLLLPDTEYYCSLKRIAWWRESIEKNPQHSCFH